MLYVTTRSKNDAFKPPVTLRRDRADDGGAFVPFRMPFLDKEQIEALAGKSFGQNVADILELFFSVKLSGWDVEMAIGRRPCLLKPMNFRIVVAELFRNVDGDMNRIVRALSEKIHPDSAIIGAPTEWSRLAVRIALLFGVFGELLRTEQIRLGSKINIAVSVGDFSAPMAAWYARQMGLPVDTVICGCNENGAPWELLHRGEMEGSAGVIPTSTPECDYAIHPNLERLICGACGHEETMRYCWSITEGGSYVPDPGVYEELRRGMFAAVVSRVRVETIIPSVYHTNRYILDPYAALAYGALADYRARVGGSAVTLLLAEKSPLHDTQTVTNAMGITAAELRNRVTEA